MLDESKGGADSKATGGDTVTTVPNGAAGGEGAEADDLSGTFADAV